MFENLGKPVIITGSQIPICEIRSDGKANIIEAMSLKRFVSVEVGLLL